MASQNMIFPPIFPPTAAPRLIAVGDSGRKPGIYSVDLTPSLSVALIGLELVGFLFKVVDLTIGSVQFIWQVTFV